MHAALRLCGQARPLVAGLLGLALAACGLVARPGDQPSPPSRLAYVAPDGHIYTMLPDGSDRRRASAVPGEPAAPAGQRLARWPTWAPNGERFAFMRTEASPVTETTHAVYAVSSEAGPVKLFESPDEAPIYMSWTPDSTRVAVLLQAGSSLILRLLPADGAAAPLDLAQGNPLYTAWSPDAATLLVHIGSDGRDGRDAHVSLLRVDQAPAGLQRLSVTPSDFRAPAWSADGSAMAYSLVVGGQALLAVQRPDAAQPVRLLTLGSEPAFLWSPTSDHLAFSSRVAGQPFMYRGVEVIKNDGSGRTRITEQEVVCFYWSPDGRRLAYAGLDPNVRALAWYVADADGKNHRQVASFLPTEEQIFMFAFFDQFAQSHAVWSPDGRYLVYAGADPAAASQAQTDQTEPPAQVFVAATDGNTPPKALAEGSIAVWPVLRR